MALGYAGFALAQSFYFLLFAAGVFGVSIGLVTVSQNLLVVQSTGLETRQRALSGLHCLYGIASWLAPLQVNFIIDHGGTLISQFWVVTGELTAVFFLSLWIPRGSRFVPEKSQKKVQVSSPRWPRDGLWVAAILALYLVAEILLSSRFVQFSRESLKLSGEHANVQLSLFFLCLTAGRLLMSWTHFGLSPSRILKGTLTLSILCLGLGISGKPWAFVATGFFMAPVYPVAIHYMTLTFHENMTKVISWAQGFGSLFVVSFQGLVGVLLDRWGAACSMYIIAAVLGASLVLLLAFEGSQKGIHSE